MSCASFGRWVSRRQSETIERDVPKNKKPKMQVPKYQTLAQVLGMNDPDAPDADQIRSSEREELDELTEDLRRDPAALAEFLELSQ